MYNLCQKAICLPKRPNVQAKKAEKWTVRCVSCGASKLKKNACFLIHGFPYCLEYLDGMDLCKLVRICEISKDQALEKLGFMKCW